MLESLNRNFGLLIGFVLPGFVFLVGLVLLEESETFQEWPQPLAQLGQLGGFLFFVLASTAAGIVLSAVRWVILDNILHATGLEAPSLDYRNLESKQSSFMLLVENNYRYYLFYGNTLIGLLLIGVAAISNQRELTTIDVVRWSALCAILFVASRDSLKRFYTRSRLLMGEAPAFRRKARR